MDRALLIVAALAVFGCGSPAREEARGEQTGAAQLAASAADPHAKLTCAACHEGKRADIGRASVPREACAASGCAVTRPMPDKATIAVKPALTIWRVFMA